MYMWEIAAWNHMKNQVKERLKVRRRFRRINERKKEEKEENRGKEQAGETRRGKDCEIFFFLYLMLLIHADGTLPEWKCSFGLITTVLEKMANVQKNNATSAYEIAVFMK